MVEKYPKMTFYYHHGFKPTVEKFLEICAREGKSPSEHIRKMIAEYVRVHEPGNPQKRLDRVLEDGEPTGPTCVECGKPATRRYFVEGTTIYRCADHYFRLAGAKQVISWQELDRPPYGPALKDEVNPRCRLCGEPALYYSWWFVTTRRSTKVYWCEKHRPKRGSVEL